jgi:hypothetical protein
MPGITAAGERSPTLVCLIGPPAVGKMTVGQELCRLTGFRLFHGHMVGDLLAQFFPFGTPSFTRLGQTWRRQFFEEGAQAGLSVVTTVAWRFDEPADTETVWSWLRPYVEGGRVYCVELAAPLDVRLERNFTENRREHKQATWVTDEYLRQTDAAHRYDSGAAFPFDVPHLKLDIEHLPAETTAKQIAEHFQLPQIANPRGEF